MKPTKDAKNVFTNLIYKSTQILNDSSKILIKNSYVGGKLYMKKITKNNTINFEHISKCSGKL